MTDISTDKADVTDESKALGKERKKYFPPVYPVVHIPVPELNPDRIVGPDSPWYMRLMAYFIFKFTSR